MTPIDDAKKQQEQVENEVLIFALSFIVLVILFFVICFCNLNGQK